MNNVCSIHGQSLSYLEKEIVDVLGKSVDFNTLDFTTHEDGVYAFTDAGEAYLLTNNEKLMKLFKSYEVLKYGEVS